MLLSHKNLLLLLYYQFTHYSTQHSLDKIGTNGSNSERVMGAVHHLTTAKSQN